MDSEQNLEESFNDFETRENTIPSDLVQVSLNDGDGEEYTYMDIDYSFENESDTVRNSSGVAKSRNKEAAKKRETVRKCIVDGVYQKADFRGTFSKNGRPHTSKIWDRFDAIIDENGAPIVDLVCCKSCGRVFQYESKKGGTANLSKHICSKGTGDTVQSEIGKIFDKVLFLSNFRRRRFRAIVETLENEISRQLNIICSFCHMPQNLIMARIRI